MPREDEPGDLVTVGDILVIGGQHVMLDSRVAEAFGTETRRVNEAVSRNRAKFTEAHCFKLTDEQFKRLISQNVISNAGRGGRRKLPQVFTVKGVARLATVLTTPAALRATDLIVPHQLRAGLIRELEPPAVVGLIEEFEAEPLRLGVEDDK